MQQATLPEAVAPATAPKMTPRRGGYTWVTWITGILSADDSCRWAAWAKTQHTYDKRPDDNAENLATWKAEHADLVNRHAAALSKDGWSVWLEGMNKFTIKGRTTTLAGSPDLVAWKGNVVRIIDGKTGQRKGKDIWQVRTYLYAVPLTKRFPVGTVYEGQVLYRDGLQAVSLTDAEKVRILDTLKEVGNRTAVPTRTPSAGECRFCDIAACPDRAMAESPVVETTEF